MAGYKRMENRSWATPYRGRLAIHAGRSKASDGRAIGIFQQLGIEYPEDFPRGVIVGTVDVAEIVDQEEYLARYGKNPADRLMAFGPLCWILKNPRPCRPIPCAGALSLWNAAKL